MNIPSLVNVISIPTTHGIKTIEVYSGDITNSILQTDLLIISAFANNYSPRRNSLIGHLYFQKNIDVQKHSIQPEIDFRSSLKTWVSQQLEDKLIKRLLCVEDLNEMNDLEMVFTNIFATAALANYKGIHIESIMMPLLGSGNQNNDMANTLKYLIPASIEALSKNAELQTIYFIEKDQRKADHINSVINDILNRSKEQQREMLDSQLFDLYNDILKKLLSIKTSSKKFQSNNTINNLIAKILSKKIRFYEIGILSRKIVELLMREMTQGSNVTTINDQIYYLQNNYNVASWMTSYIHVLKNLSNYAAHEMNPEIFPQIITEKDRIVFSYSLNRFLEFYLDFKNKN